MALRKFIIERDIPAVGTFEREQLRGAAAQSNKVLKDLGPDIQWQESYVAADKTFCVYLATRRRHDPQTRRTERLPGDEDHRSPQNDRSHDRTQRLTLDLRKIGDAMQRRAEPGKQFQPVFAQLRIIGIDLHGLEERIDRHAQPRHLRHRFRELFFFERRADCTDGSCQRGMKCFLCWLDQRGFVNRTEISAIILLFFGLQDICSALVTRKQIGAVVGLQERLKGFDASNKTDKIVFVAKTKHSIDQIVASALLAQRDFQTICKEIENVWSDGIVFNALIR